ncbi:VOC family protein [Ferrimonas pelagia]|uniref:VOC family protein n=1 Tax=Ferrimonas pelagia TaxID=1177826 RepID=A0ABP9FJX4_9GAMM
MIGYVTLGTHDLPRAAAFYDALLAELGGKRFLDTEQYIAWMAGEDQAGLGLTYPQNGEPASVGNGTMVALAADSPAKVDAVYRKAIELGAQCEGPAGPRESGFYAGYFRDLDGNKLNVFYMSAAQ